MATRKRPSNQPQTPPSEPAEIVVVPEEADEQGQGPEASPEEYVRARDEDGQFIADDPTTPEVNEAFDPPKPKYEVIRRSVTDRPAKVRPGTPDPKKKGAFGGVFTVGPGIPQS